MSEIYAMLSNQSLEPTAVGACRSAVAVHVASRRWLSFLRQATMLALLYDRTATNGMTKRHPL